MDHDHKTGQLRDLLCSRCNLTIGFIEEDVAVLASMIEYLKRWNAEDHPGLTRPPPEFPKSREVMMATQWGPMCVSDAARRAGLLPATVLGRIRNGWPHEAALQPLKRPRRKLRQE